MAIFRKFFFLGNIGKENVFHYILEEKKAFLAYKKRKLKKSKNWHFFKGVNPWFWTKNGYFSRRFFFFGNIGQEKVFNDILEQKNPFQAIETRSSKSRKIDIFPKGLNHGFGPKMAIFPKFRQCRSGKCLLRYFTTKKLQRG